MRRFYVTTFEVMHAHADIMAKARASYLELSSGMVLVSANLFSEAHEEKWHGHPEVAILPDPVFEGGEMLKSHVGKSEGRSFKQKHLTALASVGALENEGVLDLEARVMKLNTSMRLRSIL